jgi:hypothetical protein
VEDTRRCVTEEFGARSMRPNGILNDSNRTKGIITGVLGMSPVDIGT